MTDEQLPPGWAPATLLDLISGGGIFVDGDWVESKDQDPSGGVRLTQLADVGDGRWRDRSARFMTPAKAHELNCTFLEPGDVLVARMPDPLGRACLFPGDQRPCVTVVDVAVVRTGTPGVDQRWLMHTLNSPSVRAQIEAMKAGTTRKRVSRKNLATVDLRVPPIAEQKRIVAELERRFSHIDAVERSVRTAAISLTRAGGVVRDRATGVGGAVAQDSIAWLCDEQGVPYEVDSHDPNVVWVRLGDIATVGSGTTPKRDRSDYWGGTIPWVASGQISAGKVSAPSEYVTEAALRETSLRMWPAGTLLLAMYGEGQTRGRAAELMIDACCNQACAAISLNGPFAACRPFIGTWLDARYEEHRRLGGGGVQENLNLGLVRDFLVPLPGFETQRERVAEAERQLSIIESVAGIADTAVERIGALRRSLLAAAFSGRLVSQDPNDEPASELLARIAKTRAEAEAAEKEAKAEARRAKKASKETLG